MMRSLFTAVSGLKNHQTRMDVIGNNIANVNTTGFKSGRVTFADTLSQTLSGSSSPNGTTGGVNAKQIGLGMAVASVDTNFTHGSASSTGNNTDLAIDTDNGLFIVKNGNETYYTRNGNFTLDSNGNLTMNGNGYYVQGWNGVDGNVNASGDTQNLKIDMNSTMQPKATSTVTSGGNLSADDTAETITNMKLTLADGTTVSIPTNDTTTAYSIGDTVDKNKVVSINATLADGSTVKLTSGTYKVGDIYTSDKTIGDLTLTFADGATADGVRGVTYNTGYSSIMQEIELTLKDGTILTGKKSGYDYTSVTPNIESLELTAANEDTLTAKSGVGYSSGYSSNVQSLTLHFADSTDTTLSTGDYKIGDVYNGHTVTGITGELDDGTTFNAASSSTSTYAIGSKYPSNISSMTATLDDGNIVPIPSNSSLTYTRDDPYPSSISSMTATLDDGTKVFIPPTTTLTYKDTGISSYPSSVESIKATLSDGSTKNLTAAEAAGINYIIDKNYQAKLTELYPTTLGGVTAKTSDSTNSYVIGTSDYPFGEQDNVVINGITLTLSDGTNTTASSGVYGVDYTLGGSTYPSYTTTATIYDSLGAAHSIPVSFQRTDSSSNTWLASVAPGTYDNITIPSGITQAMTFDGSTGKLTSGGTMDVTLAVPYPNGAIENQQVSLDFNALTQYSGGNNASATGDGYAAGFYKDMSIGQDGVITVTYTNGEKQTAGQIAIATFNNTSGLEKSGGSLYSQSNNSGTARVGTFASQSVTVTPGALEMSNVDIANEFSDMIVTQRGFQANSKIITASDEMLQTLINMKQS